MSRKGADLFWAKRERGMDESCQDAEEKELDKLLVIREDFSSLIADDSLDFEPKSLLLREMVNG